MYKSLKEVYIELNATDLPQEDIISIKKELFKENVYNQINDKIIQEQKGSNVIVIFTEGMSYDVISPEVTPNIYKFSQQAINFRDYYNHTAATFRGLRGQLTSSYQLAGGFENKKGIGEISEEKLKQKFNSTDRITPITKALKENGYDVYFQSSNSVKANLSLMLGTLGFDRIYGLEDYKSENKLKISELSDKESYELLFNTVKDLKQPFFYGVYTVGTHVGLDSPDVKFGDGKNYYLNKFYSVDYWFGDFLKKFEQSKLAENTILIFTADHSTYPAPEFRKTFKTKSPYFVDAIPFMIYKKGIKPVIVKSDGLNSLSLTPTILQILGIKNYPNLFLGSSLIDEPASFKPYNCVSALGAFYVQTCRNKMVVIQNQQAKDKLRKFQIFSDR